MTGCFVQCKNHGITAVSFGFFSYPLLITGTLNIGHNDLRGNRLSSPHAHVTLLFSLTCDVLFIQAGVKASLWHPADYAIIISRDPKKLNS